MGMHCPFEVGYDQTCPYCRGCPETVAEKTQGRGAMRRVLDALHVELKSVVTASEVKHSAG